MFRPKDIYSFVFDKSTNIKICDVVVDIIANSKLHSRLAFWNPNQY